MAQKQLNGRIALKHDLEVNWVAAAQRSNFTPNPGEVIIYDPDENHAQARIKIGDGVRNVEELPFYSGSWNDLSDKPFYEINESGEIKTLDSKFIGDDIARVSEVPSFEDLDTVSATAAAATNAVSERVDGLKTEVTNISDLVGDTKVSDQISTAVEPIDTKITNHETDVDAHSNMGWISSEDEVLDSPTPIDADTLNGYDAAHFDDQIAVERARINTFVVLEDGSTTGDAELQDIRVGYDGTQYETAGEAVRGQVGELKGTLANLFETPKNLYNVDAITVGVRLGSAAEGAITGSTPETKTAELFSTSEWINVVEGESYIFSHEAKNLAFTIHCVDDNGTLVADSFTIMKSAFVIPTGTKKLRFSNKTEVMQSGTVQFEKGAVATDFEPYVSGKIKDDYLPDNLLTSFEGVEEYEPLLSVIDEKIAEQGGGNVEDLLVSGKNIYNVNAITVGKILNMSQTGGFSGDISTESDNDSFAVSDWIEVVAGDSYIFNYDGTNYAFRVHFANNSDVLVADAQSISKKKAFTIPADATKMRFSNVAEKVMQNGTLQLEKGAVATDYVPYSKHIKKECLLEDYTWYGKKAVFNGDSILELPYNWGKQMCEKLGMVYLENKAIGGSTLAEYGNGDTPPKDRTPLISRYQQMSTDADIVFISIGTNDWCYTWDDIGTDADEVVTTFKGALHTIIKGLLDMYLGKPIIFVTPIKRNAPNDTNGFGKSLKDYADAILDVCGQYGIPVIDMFRNCPLNPSITTQQEAFFDGNKNTEVGYTMLYDDATHPNYYGARIQARCAIGFMKSLYIL